MNRPPKVHERNRAENLPGDLFLSIGGITLRITASEPDLKLCAEGTKEKFLVHDVEPHATLAVTRRHLGHESTGEKIFDSGSIWQLYRKDNLHLFRFTSPAYGPTPYKMASFDEGFKAGNIYLHRPFFPAAQPIDPISYPLDELIFVNLLAKGRGAEIHACGIIDPGGKGHLFVGQSGAGKTTMARIWQDEAGVKILSDDRIILRKNQNKIWIYGTPWHGEAGFALPTGAPLEAIYFLQKGPKNELVPLGRTESAARLLACSFTPLYFRDAVDFTLAFFEQVVQAVAACELRFLPDTRVPELIASNW